MKFLVTGANGLVGRAVVQLCIASNDEVFACDHRTLDITDAAAIKAMMERACPDALINCAALTDVDGCEVNHERALEVNAYAPEKLAAACRSAGAVFVTISTDYVFDGAKDGFYTQRDDPNPLSVYAATKLEGERRAQAACARTIVVRTGWIFGTGGTNFLSRVIELAEHGAHLKVIHDAFGTPTASRDLARRLRELAVLDLPGIYHVTNSGEGVSYEEFARAAIAAAGGDAAMLESVSINELRRPAPRPRNSRLQCLISEPFGLAPLPFWRDALKDFAVETHDAKSSV
ncbi:MAG: dTDP-4-dehydrorhamnose reductase [Pyrinomonadaceae bacterium]